METTLAWITPSPTKKAAKLGAEEKVRIQLRAVPSPCVVLTSLFLLLMLTNGACRSSPKNEPGTVQLDFAHPTQRTLSTGERHAYQFPLAAGQYLRLRTEPKGLNISLALYRPDGRLASEIEILEDSPMSVSLVAETAGLHRLEARSLEKEPTTGSYEFKVEEIRPTGIQDADCIGGEHAFAEGERLRTQAKAASSREAIEYYKKAAARWLNAEKKQEAARAMKMVGELRYQLGEPRQALASYQQALSFLPPAQSAGLESEIFSDRSYVYIHLGNYSQALQDAQHAETLGRDASDSRREALALSCLSEVHYGYGNRWKALEYTKQALSLWQRVGDRRRRAMTLLSLGYLHTDLGETQQAADYFNQALVLWGAINDQRGQALTHAAIATLKAIVGESQQALILYERVRPILQTVGDRFWEAALVQNVGAVYQDLGQHENALTNYKQAQRIWQEIDSPANEAGTLSNIGWLHHLAGHNQPALNYFRQALSVSKALADKKYQSNALRKIGTVYNSLGNKKQALIYYKQALSLHRAGGERQGESYALSEIGKLYRSLRAASQARTYFTRALAINRARGDRFAEAETLYQLARVEADRGNLMKARSHIETALKMIETLRANVASHDLRVTYFSSIQQYFDFYVVLLMRQHQRYPAANFDALALAASERAHARSLLELLAEARANIRQGADPDLLKQDRELQHQLGALAERKLKLLNAGAPSSELLAIASEIDALAAQRDHLEMLIRTNSPRFAALTQPQPVSLNQIRRLLDDDTLLLEYSLSSERSYL